MDFGSMGNMISSLKKNKPLVSAPNYFDTSLHKGKRGQKTEKPEPLTDAQKQDIRSKLRKQRIFSVLRSLLLWGISAAITVWILRFLF
ncbi:hypothetical protein QQ054_12955 [Oscillatoria amoena NRMC-F 0135]|nr:hypothetical protein [Oscillatoria amoena NRMC-F 0135]